MHDQLMVREHVMLKHSLARMSSQGDRLLQAHDRCRVLHSCFTNPLRVGTEGRH